MKHALADLIKERLESPLTRGARIETNCASILAHSEAGRPSHEGRGLKRLEGAALAMNQRSPLTRGARIETGRAARVRPKRRVAPHTRGAD